MKIIALLQTFSFVLQFVIGQMKDLELSYNVTICKSGMSYTFKMCLQELPNQCCSTNQITFGQRAMAHSKIECKYNEEAETTQNLAPNCLFITYKGSTIDASTCTISSTYSTTSEQTPGITNSPSTTSHSSSKEHCQTCSCPAINIYTQASLGATGVLTVLLILAIIGWVCTYVILKKKGAVNINKTYTR